MNTNRDNLDVLLTRVAAGQIDALSDAQIAALEDHVHANPDAARRIANIVPTVEPVYTAALRGPTLAEWSAVWERIDDAGAQRTRHGPLHATGVWRGLTAVAAGIGLVLLWRAGFGSPPAVETGWEVRLSSANQILEMTLPADLTAAVQYDDDGIAVISLDEAGPLEGARHDDQPISIGTRWENDPRDAVRRVAR